MARRPLCAFCAGALGAQLVLAYLPQASLGLLAAFLLPAAALCALFGLHKARKARAGQGIKEARPAQSAAALAAACVLAGMLVGAGLYAATLARQAKLAARYGGASLQLTAQVEQVQPGFAPGRVQAQLLVLRAGNQAVRFRLRCASLPACEAGQQVRGMFALVPLQGRGQLGSLADGVYFEAEYLAAFVADGPAAGFAPAARRLQAALSQALRRHLPQEQGGILAAMAVGDRGYQASAINAAYRAAGLSHVLVVSGMHVTILCAAITLPLQRQRERSRSSLRLQAAASALAALLMAGVTGFEPSVMRAAIAVWVSAAGMLCALPADPITSLGLAGLCMTAPNSYAVWDIGFQLSFTAVLGSMAGGAVARRRAAAHPARAGRANEEDMPDTPAAARTPAKAAAGKLASRLRGWAAQLWAGGCQLFWVSLCASAATFPVLVFNGLSVSPYAVLSSLAVLWLADPILVLGLAAAVTGLLPALAPLSRLLAVVAGALVQVMNAWAWWVAGLPMAQVWFGTTYAALAGLGILGLGWYAFHSRVRLRVAAPALAAVALACALAGAAVQQGVVSVAVVGSARAPVAILAQQGAAAVFFRGGASEAAQVQSWLQRHMIDTIELVVDMRADADTPCPVQGRQLIRMAAQRPNAVRRQTLGQAQLELLHQAGCNVVRLWVGEHTVLLYSGSVRLANPASAGYLVAATGTPASLRWQQLLSLSDGYRWLQELPAGQRGTVHINSDGLTLQLRPQGGARVQQR